MNRQKLRTRIYRDPNKELQRGLEVLNYYARPIDKSLILVDILDKI